MTTSCRTGASFPRSPGEAVTGRGPQEAAAGEGISAARLRALATVSFAAYLDVLGKEARASRTWGPANAAPTRMGILPSSSNDALSESAVATVTGSTDRRTGHDDDGKGALSASDALAVGRDATIDPIVPILVTLAARGTAAAPEAAPRPDVRAPFEHLMARLVRRIAWSGNARTGSARLELGAGELEGATLTIHADDGVVRVALELPPGVDGAAWKERIMGRLGARGLQVEAVDVA